MDVQTDWATSPGPVDPRAVKLNLTVVRGAGVGSMESVKGHPDHTILVALDIGESGDKHVVVKQGPKGVNARVLLALCPEDARNLAHQLQTHAGGP